MPGLRPSTAVESPAPQQDSGQPAPASRRRLNDPLVAAAIEHLEEHDELWQLLEERIARMGESGDGPPQGPHLAPPYSGG